MAADSLVTEKAVVDLANAINANKAGKSELKAIANAVDALSSVNIDLAVSGSTLTLTLPGGTAKTATLPSGGGTLTPSTTDVLI